MSSCSSSFGFIMTRHVRDASTDRLWKHCYLKIREWHGEAPLIVIIDDCSDAQFVDADFEANMVNVQIIPSTFKGRGEFLPYYYFHKNHFFDVAIILHDSVFLNSPVPWESVQQYQSLWRFTNKLIHDYFYINACLRLLDNNYDVVRFFHDFQWSGCFGGMSIIRHSFLKEVYDKYQMDRLLPMITNRYERMAWERICALVFHCNRTLDSDQATYGDILSFCPYERVNFDNKEAFCHLPIIKTWTGR